MRRRVWAPSGRRPVAIGAPRYAWTYVYGFAHPATGRTDWWLLPTVDVAAMGAALAAFAADAGAGPAKRVVLVLDNAGWHASPRLAVPEGVHLAFLPPDSPELQPAERLWGPLDEPVANRTFADLDELEGGLVGRGRELERRRPAIKSRGRYPWWPRERRRKRQQ